jgi:hypothetical protein
MATARKILQEQFHDSCNHLDDVLAGIQDEEFFWEPVADCWTVHDRSEHRAAHADGAGQWVIDYEIPEPSPAPFTTIAWRTVHLGAVNILYWDYAFGPATAPYDLEMPGDANSAIAWLRASQRPLAEALSDLPGDDALDEQVPTNWGERLPVGRMFMTLVNEQVHHGAEISLLRDLYRNRETLGTVTVSSS